MKLAELVNSTKALQDLLTQKLPIELAFELKTFISKLNPELSSYDEIRNEKVKQYGGKTDDGFTVLPENLDVFFKEIAELLDKEIDCVPPVVKIKDLKGCTMSIADLTILSWLIKE
jgi:ribose 5-phosphate isomerase